MFVSPLFATLGADPSFAARFLDHEEDRVVYANRQSLTPLQWTSSARNRRQMNGQEITTTPRETHDDQRLPKPVVGRCSAKERTRTTRPRSRPMPSDEKRARHAKPHDPLPTP